MHRPRPYPACPPNLIVAAALALGLATTAAPSFAFSTYVEEFDATTFRDAPNTSADWNTSTGKLQLFPLPQLLGTTDTPGLCNDVVVWGAKAYVSDGSPGVQVYYVGNVGNPAAPTLIGNYNTPGTTNGVCVVGNRLYVADGTAGLQILDVTNPTPTLLGTYNTPGACRQVAVSGSVAYIADDSNGLVILDVSNPAVPTLLATFATADFCFGVTISGTTAYVTATTAGMYILNVSNPAAPVQLGRYDTAQQAVRCAVNGRTAYIADNVGGLVIVDVSNPVAPFLRSTYPMPGNANNVVVTGPVAYVADISGGLYMIDVDNPATPTLMMNWASATCNRVAIDGDLAYIADGPSGLRAMRVLRPTGGLFRGTYANWPDYYQSATVSGTRAYLSSHVSSTCLLQVIDISVPGSPSLIGSYATPGCITETAISGLRAYTTEGTVGLQILDVSNPTPVLLGTYDSPGSATTVQVDGKYAYLADGSAGLRIVNVSNPASPVSVGSYDTPGNARHVVVVGTVAYVADETSLQILNVSNPASPSLIASYPAAATRLAISGYTAYVAEESALDVKVIDVSTNALPTLVATIAVPDGPIDLRAQGNSLSVGTYSAVRVLDVSNPASPVAIGFVGVPYGVSSFQVEGPRLFVLDVYDFSIFDISQHRADLVRNQGRSVRVDSESDPITRVRLTSTQVNNVAWELSANGGANWYPITNLNTWWDITTPGTDLRWRATLVLPAPWATSPLPEISRMQIDYLPEHPVITSIADVPNDQGRWVRLKFKQASRDIPEESTAPATGYQIYHRVDNAALVARVRAAGETGAVDLVQESGALADLAPTSIRHVDSRTFVLGELAATAATFPPGTWEAVAYVAATQSPNYSVLVPTTGDSTSAGIDWSAFVLTVHTTSPTTWFVSRADSGYSKDNLAPHTPDEFFTYSITGGVQLDWSPSWDTDFQYFRIYRSTTSSSFIPGPSNLVHTSTATNWTDTYLGTTTYYKLTAVDFAGNESAPISSSVVVGVEGPSVPLCFALRGAAPNPFGIATSFQYDVPSAGGRVRLRVYDVAGRLVRTLVDGAQAPGSWTASWDGRDAAGLRLPAGVYLARMEARGFSRTSRVLLTR